MAAGRLTAAVVRAGLKANFSQNAICGAPVTSAQALIHGGYLDFTCDPPTAARYVSVDIDGSQPGVRNKAALTLCEVMVEEYSLTKCPPPVLMNSKDSLLQSFILPTNLSFRQYAISELLPDYL